jgi:hypothetical protein
MMNNNPYTYDSMQDADVMRDFNLLQTHLVYWMKHIKYLVPCRTCAAGAGKGFEMAVLVTPSGDKYVAAFTHPAELRKWPYECDKTAVLSFDELKLGVLNDLTNLAGVAINPFSKMFILGHRQIELLERMSKGFEIERVEHCGNLFLSRPETENSELIEELAFFFAGNEAVYKAFMLTAQEEGSDAARLLFIVDFSGEKDDLFPALAELICRHMNQGETFELMKATYHLLCVAGSVSKPIYQKS